MDQPPKDLSIEVSPEKRDSPPWPPTDQVLQEKRRRTQEHVRCLLLFTCLPVFVYLVYLSGDPPATAGTGAGPAVLALSARQRFPAGPSQPPLNLIHPGSTRIQSVPAAGTNPGRHTAAGWFWYQDTKKPRWKG